MSVCVFFVLMLILELIRVLEGPSIPLSTPKSTSTPGVDGGIDIGVGFGSVADIGRCVGVGIGVDFGLCVFSSKLSFILLPHVLNRNGAENEAKATLDCGCRKRNGSTGVPSSIYWQKSDGLSAHQSTKREIGNSKELECLIALLPSLLSSSPKVLNPAGALPQEVCKQKHCKVEHCKQEPLVTTRTKLSSGWRMVARPPLHGSISEKRTMPLHCSMQALSMQRRIPPTQLCRIVADTWKYWCTD
jgi:hypothetical protein